MSRITEKGATGALEVFQTSVDPSLATLPGSRYETADGREFSLVQVGAANIASGVVVQGPAAVANHVGLSPATSSTTGYNAIYPIAGTVGGKVIQIATGATAELLNRYQAGYLVVVEGTGLGQTLKIAGNSVAATTSALVINLEDAFTAATDTTSRFTLVLRPYGNNNGTSFATDGVIVSPATTLTGEVLGVSLYPLPASTTTVASYGLIQTKGDVAVLGSSTVALGLDVAVPSGTAGAVLVYAVATTTRIGTVVVATASAKYNLIKLHL